MQTDYEIKEGQKLWAKNGESVIVKYVSQSIIVVEYKGKKYTRKTEDIGIKLFIKKPTITIPKLRNSENHICSGCKKCWYYVFEKCQGKTEVCPNLRLDQLSQSIADKEILAINPKREMDATKYRRSSSSRKNWKR